MKIVAILLSALLLVVVSCKESTSPPTPQSLSFGTDAVALVADDSIAAGANLTMSDGSVGAASAISYSSSNASVATVDSKGFIHALIAGTAVITATVGSLHDELPVTVTWAPITSVTFSVDQASIFLDGTMKAAAAVLNSHNKPAPNAEVTYTSSNPVVATIDSTGQIRALVPGSTTITATVGALHDELEITVVPHFIELATGGSQACGITGMHVLYCWGYGELGAGTSTPNCPQLGAPCSLVPIPVTNGSDFVSVTVGELHACALNVAHVAYCWGANGNGQLGIGTTQAKATTPTLVAGNLAFASLTAGRFHTCGITTQGDTYCWGWDHWGQVGAGTTATDRCDYVFSNAPCGRSPFKVAGGQRFVQLNASSSATCGRAADNRIFCWGLEVGGTETTDCQFGEISRCTRTPLLQVSGSTFPFFGMTEGARCGQKPELTIQCWGTDYNNFGNGSAGPVTSTTPIVAASGRTYEFGRVVFGRLHVCGMNSVTVECWGNSDVGQAGGTIGTNRTSPGQVAVGEIRFSKIVSSTVSDFTCGIAFSGRTYCWGFGTLGQLGNNTLESSAVPVLVKLVR